MQTSHFLPKTRLLAVLLPVLLLTSTALAPLADTVVYVGELPLNLRSGPGPQYSVVVVLLPGEALTVIGQSGDWLNVKRQSTGQTGWVDKDFTSSTQPTILPDWVTVGDVPLNLRSGPGVSYSILAELGPGETLQAFELSGYWIRVSRAVNGQTGWVAKSYLFWVVAETVPVGSTVWIGENPLNLRSGPGPSFSIVVALQPGEALTVKGQAGWWLNVTRNSDGQTGWIHGSYVVRAAPTPVAPVAVAPMPAYVNTAFLNLRSGPGTTYPVVMKLPQGQAVTILQTQSGWAFVQLPDGTFGWVNSFYLKK